MSRFKPIKREMNYLFPPSMNDWLPEQHLARFIVEIVEQLDVQPMVRAYGTSGSAPFHPALLLFILVYGYATMACSPAGNWSTPPTIPSPFVLWPRMSTQTTTP